MELRAKDEVIIFAGSSNPKLAREIAHYLSTDLASAELGSFSDGETQVEVTENVRGGDVFVIQSTSPPANNHLMELLLTLDALKRASAGRITAVVPYYGYARQDRKVSPRVPISAKLVADLMTTAGAARRLSMMARSPAGSPSSSTTSSTPPERSARPQTPSARPAPRTSSRAARTRSCRDVPSNGSRPRP